MSDKKVSILNKNVLIFIMGLLAMVKIRFLGTFALAEIIAICSLPLVNPVDCVRNRRVRLFLIMAGIWLAGVVVSNIVNDTDLICSLKGAFNVIFLIGSIPFGYWILKDDIRRIMLFWAGLGVSSIVAFYFPLEIVEDGARNEYYRIYAFLPGVITIAGLLYYYGKQRIAYGVSIVFGVVALFQESRHIFLIMNIITMLACYYDYVQKKQGFEIKKLNGRTLAGSMAVIVLASVISMGVYSFTASRGYMGERARTKYEVQSSSNIGLMSGRRDFLISLYAGSQNPIFGYGSYAEDSENFKDQVISKIENPENVWKFRGHGTQMLKGHSYILGAWVYSGVAGLVFWLYVLVMIGKFTWKGIWRLDELRFFYLLWSGFMIWDILFSPFSDRPIFAMYIVSVLIAMSGVRNRVFTLKPTE